jgi:hypothetical protein
MADYLDGDSASQSGKPAVTTRPRERALSPTLLARVFHQPSLVNFSADPEYLSIREAGRRLNVASSAVTRQVAGLEDALGLEPFQREARRHKFSTAGESLHRHALRLIRPMEAAVSELACSKG